MNDDRFDEGYEAGKVAGYDKGYDDGRADEMAATLENPTIPPDSKAFEMGYKAGVADTKRLPQETYQEGWADGYDAGHVDAENGR